MEKRTADDGIKFRRQINPWPPPVCKLQHYEKGKEEWDYEAHDYKRPAQEYQKYFCRWTKKCKNKVRTYCACEPHQTLCLECYPDHVLSKKTN